MGGCSNWSCQRLINAPLIRGVHKQLRANIRIFICDRSLHNGVLKGYQFAMTKPIPGSNNHRAAAAMQRSGGLTPSKTPRRDLLQTILYPLLEELRSAHNAIMSTATWTATYSSVLHREHEHEHCRSLIDERNPLNWRQSVSFLRALKQDSLSESD